MSSYQPTSELTSSCTTSMTSQPSSKVGRSIHTKCLNLKGRLLTDKESSRKAKIGPMSVLSCVILLITLPPCSQSKRVLLGPCRGRQLELLNWLDNTWPQTGLWITWQGNQIIRITSCFIYARDGKCSISKQTT